MTKEELLIKIKEYENIRLNLLADATAYLGAIQHCQWEISELEKKTKATEVKTEN